MPRGVKNGILFCVCLSRVQIKASRSLQCSILKNNKDKLIALSLYSSPKCPFLSSLFFKYIKKAVPPAAAVVVVLPSRCFVCFFTISLSTRCWFWCRDTHTHNVCARLFSFLLSFIFSSFSGPILCLLLYWREKKAQCQERNKIMTKEFQSFAILPCAGVRRWRTTTLAMVGKLQCSISSSFPVQKRNILPVDGLFAPRPITN